MGNCSYLFLAGNVEYFGPGHFPYVILAVFILITLVLFPVLLMFLYPCAHFSKATEQTSFQFTSS